MVRRRVDCWVIILMPVALLLLSACGGEGGETTAGADPSAPLRVWYHTGKPEERAAMEAQVAAFERAHPGISVELTLVPEADYNTQVQSAAVAGALPDVLDLDGPFLANYAWRGWLRSLDDVLPAPLMDDLLPSIRAQGQWNGQFWGIGSFDSGLGLYVNRRLLAELSTDPPALPSHPDEAWDSASFDRLLRELASQRRAREQPGTVLDLKLNYGGEWWTYAFSPIVQSAGGDLIDREQYLHARGWLDRPAAATALNRVAAWISEGLVDANTDDQAFVQGRAVMSWSGHWDYPRYREALGEDLALVPLPNFGQGSRTGMGSWAWSISAASTQTERAAAFITFLLSRDEVLRMSAANGAVPATRSAIAASPLYGETGPLAVFVRQLEASAVPRPVTPAYPAITDAFQQLMAVVRNGGDVTAAVTRAVTAIERDIADHDGYAVSP